MADKKISQLTGATTPLAGTEVLPIVQGGNTVKVSVDNLTKGKTVSATTFDTDVAAAGVTLSGVTLSADGTDANIDINVTPKGTGSVNITKANIDGGTIDGTTIGGASAAAATVTALTASGNVSFDGGSFVFNESGGNKDFRIEGDNDQNLFFCDASADAVGIGTNAPSSAGAGYGGLDIRGLSGGGLRYGVASGFNMLTYAVGSDVDYVPSTAANIRWYNLTGTGEGMRLTSTGNLDVKAGNLIFSTAAKGIDFSANTPAAGMTTQLLNWYEEGNWTPTDNSGAGLTITVTSAKYVRFGRTVFVQAYIIYPATANASAAALTGLPFTVATNTYSPFTSTSGSGTAISIQANSASTSMTIVSPANYNTAITNATLSGAGIIFSGQYTI